MTALQCVLWFVAGAVLGAGPLLAKSLTIAATRGFDGGWGMGWNAGQAAGRNRLRKELQDVLTDIDLDAELDPAKMDRFLSLLEAVDTVELVKP